MEKSDRSIHSKRTLRRSSNSHISMSDTESITSQADSFHSPFSSDNPYFHQENDNLGNKSSKLLIPVDKYYSPAPSPGKTNVPASSTAAGVKGWRPWPHSEKPTSGNGDLPVSPGKGGRKEKPENRDLAVKGSSPVVLGLNRLVRDEPPQGVRKVVPGHSAGLEEGYGGRVEDEVGGERQSRAAVASILKRSERSVAVRKAALVFRIFEAIVCMISFSVMAADKTRGWTGDSFDRYKEYRYCVGVNIIGFAYSGFQAFDVAYRLGTGDHVFSHGLRYHFVFSMDQILAYLLISASSSAATRVDDWISNWGSDKFTLMATVSIAMSFLAFIAFALSSLISGYNLCHHDST